MLRAHISEEAGTYFIFLTYSDREICRARRGVRHVTPEIGFQVGGLQRPALTNISIWLSLPLSAAYENIFEKNIVFERRTVYEKHYRAFGGKNGIHNP